MTVPNPDALFFYRYLPRLRDGLISRGLATRPRPIRAGCDPDDIEAPAWIAVVHDVELGLTSAGVLDAFDCILNQPEVLPAVKTIIAASRSYTSAIEPVREYLIEAGVMLRDSDRSEP